jgi:ribosomal protein L11 methyltransferase
MEEIYCVKLTDISHNPDITAEFLTAIGCQFSTWQNAKEKLAFHTLYCQDKDEAEELLKSIDEKIAAWKEFGVELSDSQLITIFKEDWNEVWKKHFKIIEISDRLFVKPTWLEVEQKPGRVVIELDPGMSFGTGHHPTTNFCLKKIDELAVDNSSKSFLDAGCGSGILSIAASKLGFKSVTAFDIDPDAIIVAEENFELNNIEKNQIDLKVAALEDFFSDSKYDVIAANILSGILVKNRDALINLLKPDGHIILAGILSSEYEKLKELFEGGGLKEESSFVDGEWTSGLFAKKSKTF